MENTVRSAVLSTPVVHKVWRKWQFSDVPISTKTLFNICKIDFVPITLLLWANKPLLSHCCPILWFKIVPRIIFNNTRIIACTIYKMKTHVIVFKQNVFPNVHDIVRVCNGLTVRSILAQCIHLFSIANYSGGIFTYNHLTYNRWLDRAVFLHGPQNIYLWVMICYPLITVLISFGSFTCTGSVNFNQTWKGFILNANCFIWSVHNFLVDKQIYHLNALEITAL